MVKTMEGTAGKSKVKNGHAFYLGGKSIDSSASAIDSDSLCFFPSTSYFKQWFRCNIYTPPEIWGSSLDNPQLASLICMASRDTVDYAWLE